MAKKKTEEEQTPERLLELIDEQVKARREAVLADRAASKRIAELASEARSKGATMAELTKHVQRVDKEGALVSVTRQALDTMLAVHEQRREARTTRASRRRRESTEPAAGKLNTELFA